MNRQILILVILFSVCKVQAQDVSLKMNLFHFTSKALIEQPLQVIIYSQYSRHDTINFQNGQLKLNLQPLNSYELRIVSQINCYTGIQFADLIIKNVKLMENYNIDTLLIKSTLPPCYEWVYDPDTEISTHIPIGFTDYMRNGRYAQLINNHPFVASVKESETIFNFQDLFPAKPVQIISTPSDSVDFDTPPEFKGGFNNFKVYITNNMIYPEQAKRLGIEGFVYVKFMVRKTGEVDNNSIEVVEGFETGNLNDEAKRLIIESPNWIPAKFEGKEIDYSLILPIRFKL